MSGKMPAAYFRDYRARRRLSGNPVRRRPGYVRPPRDRRHDTFLRASRAQPRLVPLIETLGRNRGLESVSRGQRLSFWTEELFLDLVQERALAELEGRDPKAAARAYRRREREWRAHTAPLEVWAA